MSDGVEYQYPMQLMELLGLRGWENAQPRVYWGLKRPDELSADWQSPNAGIGGGAGWGGYGRGGYGMTTGGGGGYNSAGVFSGGGGGAPLGARSASPSFASDIGSMSGESLNGGAQSATLGDWLSAVGTGPTGALMGLFGNVAYNAITGQPNRQINSLSLAQLAAQIAGGGEAQAGPPGFGGDFGSVGVGAATGDYTNAGLDAASATPGFDGSGYGGGGADYGGGGASPGDPTGGGGPGALAKGGPVTLSMLAGPNPPGPDDGLAYLDAGEHVLTADEVKKIGGHGAVMRLRDLIRRA